MTSRMPSLLVFTRKIKHLIFFNQHIVFLIVAGMFADVGVVMFKLCASDVFFFCFQSMTNALAGSTTAMRTPCALTWSEATAAPVSRATLATGQSAKVSTAMLVMSPTVSCT